MLHLRIVAPPDLADRAHELLDRNDAVVNLVRIDGAARKPSGDLILCDVAREEASIVLSDLRALGVDRDGSIAIEEIDTALSDVARRPSKPQRAPRRTRSSGRRSRPAPRRAQSSRSAS